MRTRFLIPILTFAMVIITLPQVFAAFSVTISPATKILELKRGGVYHYEINITNNEAAATEQIFGMQLAEFYYDENGQRAFVEPSEIADMKQSLLTWVKIPPVQKTQANKVVSFPVDINVPMNANYGDHMALIYIGKQDPVVDASAPVSVQGRLASVLIVKVIGNDAQKEKSGMASNFEIKVREKARNTATLSFNFRNTGDEFYYVDTIAEIFEEQASAKPVKTVNASYRVFPNVQKNIQLPIGDLGDDYGEKEYYMLVHVQESGSPTAEKIIFGKFEQTFHYYVPTRDEAAPSTVVAEKQLVVMPPWVQIVKDLAPYGFGFLILLIILIRLLVSPKPPTKKK